MSSRRERSASQGCVGRRRRRCGGRRRRGGGGRRRPRRPRRLRRPRRRRPPPRHPGRLRRRPRRCRRPRRRRRRPPRRAGRPALPRHRGLRQEWAASAPPASPTEMPVPTDPAPARSSAAASAASVEDPDRRRYDFFQSRRFFLDSGPRVAVFGPRDHQKFIQDAELPPGEGFQTSGAAD